MQGVPQWRLWAPYGDPLQCCTCFYRDPNCLQPILSPGGYLPLEICGSTVLQSDKKKSGYTVQYWIFMTGQKGYLFRGLFRKLCISGPQISPLKASVCNFYQNLNIHTLRCDFLYVTYGAKNWIAIGNFSTQGQSAIHSVLKGGLKFMKGQGLIWSQIRQISKKSG